MIVLGHNYISWCICCKLSVEVTVIQTQTTWSPTDTEDTTHSAGDKPHDHLYDVSMNRNAAPYAPIFFIGNELDMKYFPPSARFTMVDQPGTSPLFGITPREGILYVNNLTDTDLPPTSNVLVWLHDALNTSSENVTVKFRVHSTPGQHGTDQQGQCDEGCWRFSKEKCSKSCGLGARAGRCTWLSSDETCSPFRYTCPNNKCDELEALVPGLCPQDCAGTSTVSPPGLSTVFNESSLAYSDAQVLPVKDSASPTPLCGWTCRALLAGIGGSISVLVIVVLLLRLYTRCRFRRHSKEVINPVYQVSSMSGLPVSYLQCRDVPAALWSAAKQSDVMSSSDVSSVINSKLEIPRKHLKLGELIGEGEFGRVFRAEATKLRDAMGPVTVAVKMLKDCASLSELRDLLSEFMLLREVDHPNVLRLYGACTVEGPLMIVVEYCEYGSLKNYLLNSRRPGGGGKNTNTNQQIPAHSIGPRDMMSFAWQISKGMQYLADMKVLHRDLATRNILMATGRVLKISDFGLSRDVYEEDTYLKKSKGRVPVKWLAPECLYENCYTSKSDVWSFGVVLWEIASLGGTPYPGVPPERIFLLLKTDYRMDKPDHCTDELYSVMLKCWRQDPARRPAFRELTAIFESLLSQDVDYLPLRSPPFAQHCMKEQAMAASASSREESLASMESDSPCTARLDRVPKHPLKEQGDDSTSLCSQYDKHPESEDLLQDSNSSDTGFEYVQILKRGSIEQEALLPVVRMVRVT